METPCHAKLKLRLRVRDALWLLSVEPPRSAMQHQPNGRIRVEQLVRIDRVTDEERVEPRPMDVHIEVLRRPFESGRQRRWDGTASGSVANRIEAPVREVKPECAALLRLYPRGQMKER